jgi:hypothetical protein
MFFEKLEMMVASRIPSPDRTPNETGSGTLTYASPLRLVAPNQTESNQFTAGFACIGIPLGQSRLIKVTKGWLECVLFRIMAP